MCNYYVCTCMYMSSIHRHDIFPCSAGVGRTGTFMCIDMLLKRLENKCTSLDVFNLVRKLRHRRERTVETPVSLP